MTLLQIVVLVGFVLGSTDSRTMLLAARGGMASQLATRPFVFVLLGGIATPALFALLIGGFFAFTWYIWLGIALIWLLALGPVVNAGTFPLFYALSPLLNIIAIAAAVAFWGDYFGFLDID